MSTTVLVEAERLAEWSRLRMGPNVFEPHAEVGPARRETVCRRIVRWSWVSLR